MPGSYVYSDIPVKYASKNIAMSRDFQEKWEARDIVVAIVDFWDASGAAQHAFADTLQLVLSAPFIPDAIAVMEQGSESIECAKRFVSASENTFVAYDSTGTLPATFPPGSFELAETYSLPRGTVVRYTGDTSHIPAPVLESVRRGAILSAESPMMEVAKDEGDPWDIPMFGKRTALIDISGARRYMEVMSCGRIEPPRRGDFGISIDDGEDIANGMSILSFASYSASLPADESTKAYAEAIADAVEKFRGIKKIWQRALQFTPFCLILGSDKVADQVDKMDASAVSEIADALGASAMIDAYLDGVPLDDVLA